MFKGFPGGSVIKNPPAMQETKESGRSPGKGNSNPLQYSCLGDSMDKGTWKATVHGVTRFGLNLTTKSPLHHQNILGSCEFQTCFTTKLPPNFVLLSSPKFSYHYKNDF